MVSLQLCSGTWVAIQEGFRQVWVQQEEDIVREQGPGGWGTVVWERGWQGSTSGEEGGFGRWGQQCPGLRGWETD